MRSRRSRLRASRRFNVAESAFSVRNYRGYFVGKAVFLTGDWIQMTGLAWLVLKTTHSTRDLGLVVSLQTVPLLLFGAYSGLIVDRVGNKLRLVSVLETVVVLQAFALGLLTITGVILLWQVWLLALIAGVVGALAIPARRILLMQLVGARYLKSALTAESIVDNVARAVGPGVAGLLIATVGIGYCFLINATAVLVALGRIAFIDRSAMGPSQTVPRRGGQLREGLRHVMATPALAVAIAMTAVVGCFAFQYQLLLPLVATNVLHAGPGTYGLLATALGAGACAGGVLMGRLRKPGALMLSGAALALALSLSIVAIADGVGVIIVGLVGAGVADTLFVTASGVTVQLGAGQAFQGRVVALWFLAWMGTAPIGAMTISLVVSATGVRTGILVGVAASGVAAALGYRYHRAGSVG